MYMYSIEVANRWQRVKTSHKQNVQETQKTVSLLNKWGLKPIFFLNTVLMFH